MNIYYFNISSLWTNKDTILKISLHYKLCNLYTHFGDLEYNIDKRFYRIL